MEDRMITPAADEMSVGSGDTASTATNPVAVPDNAVKDEATDALTGASEPSDTATPSAATYLPVYNGKICPVQADNREEITTLLQLGMKQRDFLPQYDRLRSLARDSGAESVAAYIETLCEQQETRRREEAIAQWGEEAGRRIYELERETRAPLPAQQEETVDLTAEFAALFAENPAYRSPEDVPDEVFRLAAVNGISLCDAHNRFIISEAARRATALAEQDAAAEAATGSLSDRRGASTPSIIDAFRAGLHRRM